MGDMLKHPRVVIAFYGITRSLKYTIESIRSNVIEPARLVGDVTLLCHFFKQATISNPRTSEFGLLDLDEWKLLTPDFISLQEVDTATEDVHIQKLTPYGNAWEDNGESLRNVLRQMLSLQRVTAMISNHVQSADVVIFLRADMEYHDRFPMEKLIQSIHPYKVMIPFWQWSGGLNDRFAICGRLSYQIYGSRVEKSLAYCQCYFKPLHSERLLMYVLMRSPIQLAVTSMRATRVRFNGQRALESFNQVKLGKRIDGFLRCNFCTSLLILGIRLGLVKEKSF